MKPLKSCLRFSPREALQAGDGLFSVSSGNPALPAWLGPHVFDLAFKTESESEKYARQIRSSAGIAVFAGDREDNLGRSAYFKVLALQSL